MKVEVAISWLEMKLRNQVSQMWHGTVHAGWLFLKLNDIIFH